MSQSWSGEHSWSPGSGFGHWSWELMINQKKNRQVVGPRGHEIAKLGATELQFHELVYGTVLITIVI